MSREAPAAAAEPKPTAVIGIPWARRVWAAVSGATPGFEAPSVSRTSAAIGAPASRRTASSRLAPRAVCRPVGSGSAGSGPPGRSEPSKR